MKLFVHLFFLILMFSCIKPIPQLPSNKENKNDTISNNLLKINELLTYKENKLIQKFAKTEHPDFIKNKMGFWYKIQKNNNTTLIEEKDKCSVFIKISNFNGDKLKEEKKNVTLGKKELISGVEECIKLMSKGDRATIIVPWYLAYGLKGNGSEIAPYTSLIIEIKITND